MIWKTLWVVLERVAVVVTIVASATVVWSLGVRRSSSNTVSANGLNGEEISGVLSPVAVARPSIKGSPTARWAIAEFSDYQCPFCARHATEVLPEIEKDFISTGKLKYLFVNSPIENIHPHAVASAQAAECAGAQNNYWKMHDQLFQNQKALPQRLFKQYAEAAKLDMLQFEKCTGEPTNPRIAADSALGTTFGIRSTPSFLLGEVQKDGSIKLRRRLTGLRPYAEFKSILDGIVD